MESQPQNPEFRFNLENFHPCVNDVLWQHLLMSSARKAINFSQISFVIHFPIISLLKFSYNLFVDHFPIILC